MGGVLNQCLGIARGFLFRISKPEPDIEKINANFKYLVL